MDIGDYCNQPRPLKEIPVVPVLPTVKDALDYNMCHANRGYCLIIENENFSKEHLATKGLSRRYGSEVDSQQLTQTFEMLGFYTVLKKDSTLNELFLTLKQFAAVDHSENDCFVCIVLTHGEHGKLYARDGRYPIDNLFQYFLGTSCPSLVGKPKLFFIQACQGSRLDPGVIVQDSNDTAAFYKIPTYADFMIAYSTIPGFYSFRNTEKGCWFIRALVQTLQQYHQDYDILTLMTIVCQRVAYDYSSRAVLPEMSHMKQVPCITSMLTRRVFLFPKSISL